MASYNKVILIGNLTRDVEIRNTPSGTAVADLGLAINESYKPKDGKEVKTTIFVDVVVWGRQAETANQYLSKGSAVLVEGRLQQDSWETDAGDKRTKMRIRADRVQFLDSRKEVTTVKPKSAMPESEAPEDFDDFEEDVPF
jgi:single-strand DNA-binding protein